MSKIDNFNEFRINEADESPRSKEALITVFCETLMEIIEDTTMDYSYSTFAQANSKRPHDPVADFNVMLAHFGRHGWTKKALDNFFAKYGKDVVDAYGNGSNTSRGLNGCVGVDLFLYFQYIIRAPRRINNNFALAGYDYADAIKTQGPGEFWIKFGYGYQNTKYGNLVINQQLGDIKAWYEIGYKNLLKGMFDADGYMNSTLADSDWDTPKIKSLIKKGTTWDGNANITIDLSAVEDNLGEDKFGAFLNDFTNQLSSMGFAMKPGEKDDYDKGGIGSIKRSVIKLTMKK